MPGGPPTGGKRPQLRVVDGGRSESPARVVVAAEDSPPFSPDALVLEQDTDLVLTPPASLVQEPGEHTGRLLLRVLNQQPHPPGSVLTGGGRPLRLHAVVHDMDCQPSWRDEWVQAALTRLFEVARRRQIARLAMPLLGTVYGQMDVERALAMTMTSLSQSEDFPRRVWLRVPGPQVETLRALLARC